MRSGAIAQTPSVGDVETRFCNDGNTTGELDLITKAGKNTSICMEFTNPTKVPITLNIEFLDSAITADTYQER